MLKIEGEKTLNKYAQRNYFEKELQKANKRIEELETELKAKSFKPINMEQWKKDHPNAINFDNSDMLDLRLWLKKPELKADLEKLMREVFDIIVNQDAQGETCIPGKVYVEIFNEPKRE